MVRLARTDGSYAGDEQGGSTRCSPRTTDLAAGGGAGARREAEVAEAAAQDTVQFTRLIKEAVPYEERTGVVEALWRVAATDGINADERGLMRLVADLLGVSDVDSGLARQRAIKEA